MDDKMMWEMWLAGYVNGEFDSVTEFREEMVRYYSKFSAEEIDAFIKKYGEEHLMTNGKAVDGIITAVAESLVK